jgi:hypothetical protein
LIGAGAAAVLVADVHEARALLAEARDAGRQRGKLGALGLSLAWSADLAYSEGEFGGRRVRSAKKPSTYWTQSGL